MNASLGRINSRYLSLAASTTLWLWLVSLASAQEFTRADVPSGAPTPSSTSPDFDIATTPLFDAGTPPSRDQARPKTAYAARPADAVRSAQLPLPQTQLPPPRPQLPRGYAPNGPLPIVPAPNAPATVSIPIGQVPNNIEFAINDGLVSIVARNAALSDILSTIANAHQLNLICPSVAAETINVSLEQVELRTALDTILAIAGYTWTTQNGIILVTNSANAPRLAPQTQGRVLRVFELDFAAAEDVDLAIKGLLSTVGQSFITQSSITDNRRTKEIVVVEDLPGYMARIEEYICQVDQAPRQVMIHAHILEVELDSNDRHGVNFEYLANLVDPELTFSTNGFANPAAPQAFFIRLDGARLDGLVEALRTTNETKTLASPRLMVVNGQEARLQIGEQLGFRVTTVTETSALESVDFLDVGVVLRVTPRISRDGRILMRVQPEVSSGDVNPDTGLPEEDTTELQTDVLLYDGQGIVVGGLIKEDLALSQAKVPILGEIPYLGAAFQRRVDDRRRSEIIIALIPHILEYGPELQTRNEFEMQRVTTPLTHGPVHKVPRPSEPQFCDPLEHPVQLRDQVQQKARAACDCYKCRNAAHHPIDYRHPMPLSPYYNQPVSAHAYNPAP